MNGIEYLLSNINNLNGIGTKTANLLKKKSNINTIFDIFGIYQEILLIEAEFLKLMN